MFQSPEVDSWQDFLLPCGRGMLAGKSRGHGSRLLLCIHGYGNDRHLFDGITADISGEGFTVVSMELPFFGGSAWPEGLPISEKELGQIWDALSERFPHSERNLVCFSLGAKFGLGMLLAQPGNMSQVVLIAPDGLKPHPMYRFCIYNPVGRSLFRLAIKSPRFFLFVLRTLYNLKIADAFKYRFVQHQFAPADNRALLRKVWFGFSKIRPKISQLAHLKAVQWHLFWGEQDNILPSQIGKEFVSQIPRAELHLLKAGHWILKSQSGEIKTQLERIFAV
jgi:pimeloyl-ACP methyl ester carboxylesterase